MPEYGHPHHMILDTIDNAHRYEMLSPRFAKGFAFIRSVDPSHKLGRVDIEGDNIYALVQRYTTIRPEEAAALGWYFEAHRKYLDIQYVHTGFESILWSPLSLMKEISDAPPAEKKGYDEK